MFALLVGLLTLRLTSASLKQKQTKLFQIPNEWTTGEWVEESTDVLDKDLDFYYRYPSIDKDCIYRYSKSYRTNITSRRYLNWRWAPLAGVEQPQRSSLGFLLQSNSTTSTGASESNAPPLVALSREDMFTCLNGRHIHFYGDSLSRQMMLSLNGMLFEMNGNANNSMGNDGQVVINDPIEPELVAENGATEWIPHRGNFRTVNESSNLHGLDSGKVVHTYWKHSNYWCPVENSTSKPMTLRPDLINGPLMKIVENMNMISKTGHEAVIVLAMGHWWQGSTAATVNFTKHSHLRYLKRKDHNDQKLSIFELIIKNTVDYMVTNFKGIVIWRTSSSSQYHNDTPALSCFDATASTPPDDAIQLHNFTEMNAILRKYVKPLLTSSTHSNHLLLDVADLSVRRKDALAGALGDCTHWCLPGVPDLWNMIMLNSICRDSSGVNDKKWI